ELLGRFIDVCNAVEYAHSRGILHRDLKPGNIMLGKYGETLVVDWGLAKALGQRGSANDSGERTLQPASAGGSAETQMGSAIGTPQYMSPEQAEGRIDELGPATDVYSLGATLYCLLAGRAPFPDAAVGTTVKQVSQGDFPPPQRIKRAVPMALQAVCLKAMARKPEERYASARSLAGDVEHWLADEPVSVYREPFSRRVNRWVRNHKATTGAVAAAAVVLLVASAVGLTLGRRANERVRALEKADALCTVRADGVPFALDNLRPVGRLALERLREHFTNPQADATQRLHAAFGLADLGETPTDFLLDAIPAASGVECRNLVAALALVKEAALARLTRRVELAADAAEKARYAIVALHLGDANPARDALAVRSDPIDRTTLIHAYAAWHGDLIAAAELLRTSDSAFWSGLCVAFGTIAPETLESQERDLAAETLLDLYTTAPDGATHSAAGWALRKWKRELPAIATTSQPPSDRRWFVNGQGMTMVEIAAGTFSMGTAGEKSGNGNYRDGEKPAHEVTLTKPFYLCDREVTIEQFWRFIDDADYPAAAKPEAGYARILSTLYPTPDCPVSGSWFNGVLYCNWLSK
ncbi:MAG TPA: bifunctional serine/threonine-protein kinase/formylglycine-generating enzyme family protein, partial [Pirellulales bacterium]|nr:bifunctional serine/threonine-protein kinase/formylglycine-generating enzyme family protein [Pirellulales bacterium]